MPPARLFSRLRGFLASHDVAVLALPALALLTIHTLTNGQYGFHRDELATLDDARYLAWGYVAYPPLTPFVGRMALELFGPSLAGVRFFAALAQALAVVIAGLMARQLGGGRARRRWGPLWQRPLRPSRSRRVRIFQYVSFDYLWWVLAAWFLILLLHRRDARWWAAIGGAIGMGMMTKYSMLFLVAGIAGAILLTEGRRYLASRRLWIGAAIALTLFLPNAIWEARHGFISLDFLRDIHARDIRIGRTAGFLTDQIWVTANPISLPLWIAGLVSVFAAPRQKWHRAIGWMFAIPFALFLAAKGRGYYMAPAYPMLFAAGAVWGERHFGRLACLETPLARCGLQGAGDRGRGHCGAGSAHRADELGVVARERSGNGGLSEEIGWPELVETVAHIRDSLPPAERLRLGILTGNYGEAGAIDLYGGHYGLPKAISGINSYWLRGYGDPPPETLIVLGFSRPRLEGMFESCELAGHTWNRYGVKNEETARHPDIFLCRRLRRPWPEFWRGFRSFG